MKKRRCPLCNSSSAQVLYIQEYSVELNHAIACCKKCGFIYVNNTRSQKFYNKYYAEMSKYEDTRDSELHEESSKIIMQFANKSDQVIDIGCSTGHLLYLLNRNNYKNLLGVDPAPKCKEIAQKKYNIKLVTASIDSFKSTKKFDFIVLATVLEHLEELQKSMKKITSLLNDEGKVFISVPNAGNFYQKFEEPFGEFSTEHINFFSTLHLHEIMKEYSSLYIRADHVAIFSVWQKIKNLKTSMNSYIKTSKENLDKIKKVIKSAPKKIVVWGAGSLTQRLLQSSDLKHKVVKFVDKNANLIGKEINNIKIISPDDLSQYNEPILISSFKFKEEITQEIKKRKLKNRVITF